MSAAVWTIGHSNHSLERFLDLLNDQRIEFAIDVRSYPYSRYAPQFDRESLEKAFDRAGIRYLFFGESLGGRPSREEHYDQDGRAMYDQMAAVPAFQEAIDRLVEGAEKGRLAIFCSCGKPDECHRRLLVGRVLADRGVLLHHVMPDGSVDDEDDVRLPGEDGQSSLFGEEETPWRSTQSVSHRRRLSTSSAG